MGTIKPRHRKRLKPLNRSGTPAKILQLAGNGALLLVVATLSGPALGIAAQRYLFGQSTNKQAERARLSNRARTAVRRLKERKLIRIVSTPTGDQIALTDRGQGVLKSLNFEEAITLRRQKWDGKWRILLFDIPETKRAARHALRRLLQDAGFFHLQQSVFVTPYPCEKEARHLAEYFDIQGCITCAVATELGEQEEQVRKYFGL